MMTVFLHNEPSVIVLISSESLGGDSENMSLCWVNQQAHVLVKGSVYALQVESITVVTVF